MFNGLGEPRRVVITGLGCVTPIGIGRKEFWRGLTEGRSGTSQIEGFDVSDFAIQIAAEVKDFDADAEIPVKDRRHVARTIPLALAAAREALSDAGVDTDELTPEERRRFGVVLGTGGGGLSFTESQYMNWYLQTGKKASVYTVPSSTHGGHSSELSMTFSLRGLSHVISTGCTSSTDALGYAAQHVALGKNDMFITGGVDAPITRGIMEGFNMMTVLTKEWNHEPGRASRPFSRDRSGIVLGEGSWFFIVESLEGARKRGARIYAEIAGYGSTCDAYHRVRIEEDGIEPARAISLALQDAGIAADEVQYVNLHGTATEINDRIETKAVKIALGERSKDVSCSATKSQIGHPQGASGAAGIASALLTLERGVVAPTINLDQPDADCDLDYTPNISRKRDVGVAVCNCIGFGSKNSAVVLRALNGADV
ncbi:MAG: beta-ketoacyl-[acyl-carrier-protein] synthase family protein [Pyrinomonadaceae bacterium]|nr:beta-ketoacyl-[acyl-carrier-protein] synthase family protein [Pyrinomonadaceae bacterium]